MTKFLIKLLVATGLLSSCISASAGAYLRETGGGHEWMVTLPDILQKYHIEWSQEGGHHTGYYYVSGRLLCPGVFLLQSVINGVTSDLVFENKLLAEEFVKSIEAKQFAGGNIYAQYHGAQSPVVAVGYYNKEIPKDANPPVKTVEHKENVSFLYLKYEGHTPENYSCKNPAISEDTPLSTVGKDAPVPAKDNKHRESPF